MIPVACTVRELNNQRELVDSIYAQVCKDMGVKKIPFSFGTMIELPRAALTAERMAETAEFFSFGTNDLTQMFFGFSRDDIGSFLPAYLNKKILPADPFQTLDQEGLGELIKIGIERGRSTRPELKVGICGEHGGDPESVKFCHRARMNYVSCSPFRVPIARFAAAQAAVEEKMEVTRTQRKVSVKKRAPAARPSAPAKKKVAAKKKAPVKVKKTAVAGKPKAVKKVTKKATKKRAGR
jgi:pyruvate,orthophosphate dikinase